MIQRIDRMKQALLKTLMTGTLIACSSPTLATSDSNSWDFTANAYMWAMNMKGTVKTDNQTSKVNETFGDILSQLRVAGMLWLTAQKGDFQVFFNGLFSVLDQKSHVDGVKIKTTTTFKLLAPGVAYTVFKMPFLAKGQFSITPYLGARYTYNKVKMKAGGTHFRNHDSWLTPYIGARFTLDWNQHWLTELATDMGATGENNYSTNTQVFVGYKDFMGMDNATLYVGYRYLHQYYKDGHGAKQFKWDMKLFGPIAGVSFTF
jgi:hypothetical protein